MKENEISMIGVNAIGMDDDMIIQENKAGPQMMTLYQAYRRKLFSDDPDENLKIYNEKRRGYEGHEKTVLISL
jgi:hypothetical protein